MKVGIDITEVSRFAAPTQKLLNKLFTPEEIAYCSSFPTPAQHFAGTFSAKEAVMKALGAGLDQIAFTHIKISHTPSGAPTVCLTGTALACANLLSLKNLEISISHTATLATAICIAT